jgi:hypothetical protein
MDESVPNRPYVNSWTGAFTVLVWDMFICVNFASHISFALQSAPTRPSISREKNSRLEEYVLFEDILRPPPPSKKSVFVKNFEIEINAWEASPSSDL